MAMLTVTSVHHYQLSTIVGKKSSRRGRNPSSSVTCGSSTKEEDQPFSFSTSPSSSSSSSSIISSTEEPSSQSWAPIFDAAAGSRSSASHGRRGFALATAISVMIPLHWPADMVAAGELSIIQDGVRNVLSKAKAAGVLRMVFHDAGTFDMDENSGGMNGSIVYELDRPENIGLSKTFKILEKAKREIDKIQQVSWADLIAVAGAEAVALCGGPNIAVQLGRLDVSIPDPQGKLPLESLDAPSLKKIFLKKGFSTQELVALSGAHTLGSKGFGSPIVFDNSYYKILLEKPWTSPGGMSAMVGLPSDRALVDDDECLRWIETYAGDEMQFFDDFRNAYVKLVNSGAVWATT
ncbi:putative L-ascorbate peroxidase 6 isoform X2 [Iris pallida]|uniref:L-ascorbate peroxidase n=1 Tax=Iris pallida TaxID=29817 RepID=A0AAX6GW35_IRIPA|nr:putative L-ascorbate peroxidase 6 isoform X2 [Iris pallida]